MAGRLGRWGSRARHPQGPRGCEPSMGGILGCDSREDLRGAGGPHHLLPQVQTRSSDEPMTTFVVCNECGNRWKVCG